MVILCLIFGGTPNIATVSSKISISDACLEYFLDRLKDHQELQVEQTQAESGRPWAQPRACSKFSSSAAAQAAAGWPSHPGRAPGWRDNSWSLSTLPLCLVRAVHVVPGPGPALHWERTLSLSSHNVSLGTGWLRCCPWNTDPSVGRVGEWGKDRQPQWEEAISILVVTYLRSDLIMWS